MMRPMERDWARLGAALKAAREARGIHQVPMGERIGVGRSTVQNIERGSVKKVTPTIRAYAREVGWTDGSIDAVLAGGDPTLAPPSRPAAEERAEPATGRAGLPLRIVRELNDGELLDSTVIPLSDDGGGRMVIVVRGQPDATPEQIKRALLQWERREMELRGMRDAGEDPPSVEQA